MNTHIADADLSAITDRQKAAWAGGDFSQIARQLVPVSEDLCAAVDPHSGRRLLDVACGSGNTALIAARRYCEVSGIDFVPAHIEYARQRAAAEHAPVDFQVQDAQALDFPDARFDFVVSAFGVMFAPDQKKAAAEMVRVCRPGGKIGLANWTSDGFGGDFFITHARNMPPESGLVAAGRWGTEAGLKDLFGGGIASLETRRRTFRMYFRSLDHAVEAFRKNFGPTSRAFSLIEPRDQQRLQQDLWRMFEHYNRATDGTAVVECDYLQAVATRR